MQTNKKEEVIFIINMTFAVFVFILMLATLGALTGILFEWKVFSVMCAKVYMFFIFPCVARALWRLK